MNPEEIKMLIKLFNNITDGAYSLMIIFLIKSYLSMILGYLFGGISVFQAAKLIKFIINKVSIGSKINNTLGEEYISRLAEARVLELVEKNKRYIIG